MREIKFRVWDERFKEWTTALTTTCGRTLSVLADEGEIVMQFTGLKDKNGKEIYEGDILHAPLEEKDGPWAYPLIFTVEWDSFSYEDEYENNGTGHWCEGYDFKAFEPETCEVIGNIYESPELLEEAHV